MISQSGAKLFKGRAKAFEKLQFPLEVSGMSLSVHPGGQLDAVLRPGTVKPHSSRAEVAAGKGIDRGPERDLQTLGPGELWTLEGLGWGNESWLKSVIVA